MFFIIRTMIVAVNVWMTGASSTSQYVGAKGVRPAGLSDWPLLRRGPIAKLRKISVCVFLPPEVRMAGVGAVWIFAKISGLWHEYV